MARSRNKKRRDNYFSIANAQQALPFSFSHVPTFRSPPLIYDLRQISDRRTWHPEGMFRPAPSFNRPRHDLVVAPLPKRSPAPIARTSAYSSYAARTRALVSFAQPQKVLICVRRQRRREVLHALKKTGRGGQRPPRRSWFSSVSCR